MVSVIHSTPLIRGIFIVRKRKISSYFFFQKYLNLTFRILPELIFNSGDIENSSSWNRDSGYDESVSMNESYPLRVLEHGAESGVLFYMNGSKLDFDYLVSTVQGQKVYFHVYKYYRQNS